MAMLVLAGAVSCETVDYSGKPGVSEVPVSLSIGLPDTKSVVDSTTLPDSYTIYVSAYHYAEDGTSVSEDYFSGVGFNSSKADSLWHANPVRYWPLGGQLDFLGIATELAPEGLFTWGDRRNTDGVIVDLPDTFQGTTEVLYSFTEPYRYSIGNVPMVFHHTQAWLQFNFVSKCEGLVRLEDITVNRCYTYGRLYVQRHPLEIVKWDTDKADAHDMHMPGLVKGTPLDKGEDRSYDMLILPKEGRSFTVTFRQRANLKSDWEKYSVAMPMEYDEPLLKWKAGVKYVYNFVIDPELITFTAETTSMEAGDTDFITVEYDGE